MGFKFKKNSCIKIQNLLKKFNILNFFILKKIKNLNLEKKYLKIPQELIISLDYILNINYNIPLGLQIMYKLNFLLYFIKRKYLKLEFKNDI